MVLDFIEVLDKTRTGEHCSEKDWDFKVVPSKTMEILKEHGLKNTFDRENPINTDSDLADAFWRAGYELALRLGMFCPDTERIVKFSGEELKEALENVPTEYSSGFGKDKITVRKRYPEDKIPPTVAMGALGLEVSEELYVPIVQSIAQYKCVDIIIGCTFKTIHGREIRARTPYETLAGMYEAVLVKEAVRRAGRPGMALWGVEGAATEYGQFGGFCPRGFEPERTLAIALIPEPTKLPYHILHRVAQSVNGGYAIEAGHMLTIGGYYGPPEGAVVGSVAAQILETASMVPTVVESTILDFKYMGNCGREALWATSVSIQARSRNSQVMDLGLTSQVSGPCTDMLLYESAAIALADAVSGISIELGTRPAACRYTNYGSGLENKFTAEVLKASPKVKLKDVNDILKAILPKYEDKLKKPPKGKSFMECTDLNTLKPTKEWQEIYEKVWKELEDLGLQRMY